MERRDAISQLLTEFGVGIGIADLAFDEVGMCHLCIDATRPITLRRDDERRELTMIGMVAEALPEDLERDVLRAMLASSLGVLREDACTVSLDEPSGMLVVHASCPFARLTGTSLDEMFGRFLGAQIDWMKRLGTRL